MTTPQEQTRQEAGPKLDALIAERVMGFARHDLRWESCGQGGLLSCTKCTWSFCCPPWSHARIMADDARWCGEQSHRPVPRYSTSIADAWLVVEKMREMGWGFVFNSVGARGARAFFTKGDRFFAEDGDTAPLAICLASLQAVAATPSETAP